MALLKNPKILVASDLRLGEALFLGPEGWTPDCLAATVAHDDVEAAALEARGKSDVAANRVVDVYLTEVEIGPDGSPVPLHYREKMRIRGPSVRPDLGKQAWLGQSGDVK